MRRRLAIAVGVGLVLLLAALYALTLIVFERQSGKGAELTTEQPRTQDFLAAEVSVSELDPKLEALHLRITLIPVGRLGVGNNVSSRYPLDIVAFGPTGQSELRVRAGQVPPELTLNTDLLDGDVGRYPFDHYSAGVGLRGTATIAGRRVPVAFYTNVDASFAGFKFDAHEGKASTNRAPLVVLKIRRSATTIGFAVFVMVMMWLLALAAIVIAVRFVIRAHRLELGFAGMFVGLLFAFPAIRNSLPGVPPVGVLLDFLSFLWAEGLIAISLLSVLVLFIRRGSSHGDPARDGVTPYVPPRRRRARAR